MIIFQKEKNDKVTMLLEQSEQLLDVDYTKIISTRVQNDTDYNRRNYRQILRNISPVAQLAED